MPPPTRHELICPTLIKGRPQAPHRMVYRCWRPTGQKPGDLPTARGGIDSPGLPPVLCVHGFAHNGLFFETLAEQLAEQGRTVYAPDMPGRGDSDWLADPRGYRLSLYLLDIMLLLHHIGAPRADWLGVSMGGVLGMAVASWTKSPVRRLVLGDVGAEVSTRPLRRIRGYIGLDPCFPDITEAESYVRKVYRACGPHADVQWRRLTEIFTRRDGEGNYRLNYDPHIARALKWLGWRSISLWPLWDHIEVPVLVLRGDQSPILTADTAAAMTERGPPCRVIEFSGIGHAPSLMVPGQIAPTVDFLMN